MSSPASTAPPELPLPVIDRSGGPARGPAAWLRWLAWSLAAAAIAAGTYWVAQTWRTASLEGPHPGDRPPGPPPREFVFALGRLEPDGEMVSVAAPGGAGESRVEKLLVDEGATVAAGEVLAILDNERRLKAALRVAHDAVAEAEASLQLTELDMETTRDRLAASLQSAKAALTTARSKDARQQRLLRGQATSRERAEEARLEVATAAQSVREAEARLERYRLGQSGEALDIRLARTRLGTARSQLEKAQADLDLAYIRAPSDGVVLRVRVREGERIGQAPLMDMGDTRTMMARLEVYESQAGRLRAGQDARLKATPLEFPLRGVVERVSQLVRRQEIVSAEPAANTDARVVEVWVRLDANSSQRAAAWVNLQVRAEITP